MPKKKSGSTGQPLFPGDAPPKPAWTGSFRPGGSFYADGPGTDALTVGVLELFSVRRLTSKSPAEFAALVWRTAKALPAFHEESLTQWAALERFEDWQQARAQGSAEVFVKYEGCAASGTWAGGHHVPREKINWEPPMPDHVREALNAELVESIDRLAGIAPPVVGETAIRTSFGPPRTSLAELERRRREQLSEYERVTGISPVANEEPEFIPELED